MSDEQPVVKWQLPVKQSFFTDHEWIHPRANYHAFQTSGPERHHSLCGKYAQDIDFFETDMPEGTGENYICKACRKRLEDSCAWSGVLNDSNG
ncbi:hypothetical protein ACTHPH_21870 [Paenibacillus pasadenensis]|uniref:hypothetical protein n=1 Tax=Paenibacillus pasadenensis TaxID=217090 RepID=UPI000491763C|nr:hypothetical protein [Paenibacillus pasadenensis]